MFDLPNSHLLVLLFFSVVITLDIYSLKTVSEWKCALEKSLNDAANFPLPMEVFKVKDTHFSFTYRKRDE